MGYFILLLKMCLKDKMKHEKEESVSFLRKWLTCIIEGAVVGMTEHC